MATRDPLDSTDGGRLRRLEALDELLPTLTGVLDVREVFERISRIAQRVIPHDMVALPLISEDGQRASVLAGYDVAGQKTHFPVDVPLGPAHRALAEGGWDHYIFDDIQELPAEKDSPPGQMGLRAMLRIAIYLEGRLAATLDFASFAPGVYTSADALIGRRIADHVALALSHQRLAERSKYAAALEAREANLEMLDGLLSAIAGVLDIRAVFDRVSEIASKVLPHDAMGLPILTDDREHMILFATAGMPSGTVPAIQPIPDRLRRMFTEPWDSDIVDHIPTHPDFKGTRFDEVGYRSQLRVPIRLDGRIEGLLGFLSRTPAAYTQGDALIARRIASHIAMAMSHQRLADQSRKAAALAERASSLQMLEGLLTTLKDVLDIREVFDRVSEIGKAVMPHDGMTITTANIDAGTITTYAATGVLSNLPTPYEFPVPDRALFEQPWDFLIIDDLQNAPKFSGGPAVRAGMRSLLAMPFNYFGGELKGGVNFFATQAGRFTRDDVAIARRITDHIAMALSHHRIAEAARRNEELRARTANLELLDELLARVNDEGELADVFDRISAITGKVLRHDALFMPIFLPDGKHVRPYVWTGMDHVQMPDTLDVPEELQDPDWDHDIIDDLALPPFTEARKRGLKAGFRSVVRVAIKVDGRKAGAMAFLSKTPGAFEPADVAVARRIADRVALRLASERRFEAARRADEAAARAAKLEARVRALTEELDARVGYRRVIGESQTWRRVLTQATQVAATDTTVLLLGESGTGKEVVARFIHRASTRRDGPFVALNCAALPEQLLEAELFGYERGAFTGATQSKPGQLEQAAGGVLFLDEVGEMSPQAQAKFLRVLQEREFQRLGGTRVLRTDARVVAATNRDLQRAMEQGQFREDLFYRLNVFAIRLPPLRDRRDDVLPLSEAFLAEFGRAFGRPPAGISREAKQMLLDYHWPGNVRELRNILERAAILCDGGLIIGEHLSLPATVPRPASGLEVRSIAPQPPAGAALPAPAPPASESIQDVERAMIERALQNARFNKSKAAKELGLSRHQLYVRMRRYGME